MRTIFRFLILALHCFAACSFFCEREMRAGERERDGRGTVLALICGYYCLSGRGIRTTYEGDVFGCFILISYPFPALHSRDASTKVKRRGRKWLVKGDCMLSLGEKWESFTAIETTATTTTKEEKKKMGLVEEVSAAPNVRFAAHPTTPHSQVYWWFQHGFPPSTLLCCTEVRF